MDADFLLCKNIITGLVIMVSALVSIFILSKVMKFLKPSKPTEVTKTKTVVWDLKGLEKELRKRVFGQDEALNKILQAIREVVSSRKANSRPKTILLLGGPGVGKHHVLNIIKNHITERDTQLRFESTLIPIKTSTLTKHVLTPDTNGIRPMFAYASSLYYSCNDNKNVIEILNCHQDPLCFVTGPVMSQWTAQNIASFAKYENYINCKECTANHFGSIFFKNSDIIIVKFKPLTQAQIQTFLKKEDLTKRFPRDGKDFVSIGFKGVQMHKTR
jgi:hypothetical protein